VLRHASKVLDSIKKPPIGLTVIINHLKANVSCALTMSLVLLAVIRYYLLKILPALILMKSMHVKYIADTTCYPARVPNSQKESNL